ncbi:hypothetical protein IWX90DRAFT_226352 [Phyllosticta citrichinensis]|uniref:Uncharacterized protein n=1 Tax=Phyllosticta citrichinensis TaxID=1130410 RepID=A0ABR1XUF0_9PEZI
MLCLLRRMSVCQSDSLSLTRAVSVHFASSSSSSASSSLFDVVPVSHRTLNPITAPQHTYERGDVAEAAQKLPAKGERCGTPKTTTAMTKTAKSTSRRSKTVATPQRPDFARLDCLDLLVRRPRRHYSLARSCATAAAVAAAAAVVRWAYA